MKEIFASGVFWSWDEKDTTSSGPVKVIAKEGVLLTNSGCAEDGKLLESVRRTVISPIRAKFFILHPKVHSYSGGSRSDLGKASDLKQGAQRRDV